MAEGNEPRHEGRPVTRALIAIVAALAIGFCAWSMSQYVAGRDPLALIDGSGALQTTAETDPSTQMASISVSRSIGEQDVRGALSSLSFDGRDVSLASDQASVVVSGDGVWVEELGSDSAADAIDLSTARASALASWAANEGAQIAQVTWISEDTSRAVRLVLCIDVAAAPTAGDVGVRLQAANAYHISSAAYVELGDALGYDRENGGDVALPDGTVVAVAEQDTSSGGSVAGSVAGPSETGSSSSGGLLPSSGGQESSQVTVSVAVDGSAAGAGSSSARATLPAGATAYDALVAVDSGVSSKGTGYGTYVSAIDGLAEKEHGASSGWVYAVNGVEPGTACSNYVLSDGDSVIWTYVNVE